MLQDCGMRGVRSFNGLSAPSQNLHSPACLLFLGQALQHLRTLCLRLGVKSCRLRMLMALSTNSGERPFSKVSEPLSCNCVSWQGRTWVFIRVPFWFVLCFFQAAGLEISWKESHTWTLIHVSRFVKDEQPGKLCCLHFLGNHGQHEVQKATTGAMLLLCSWAVVSLSLH